MKTRIQWGARLVAAFVDCQFNGVNGADGRDRVLSRLAKFAITRVAVRVCAQFAIYTYRAVCETKRESQ